MEAKDVAALAAATAKLRAEPSLIHKPELGFFREFLLTLPSVRLPENVAKPPAGPAVTIDLSDGELEASEVAAVTPARNGKSRAEAPPAAVRKGSVDSVIEAADVIADSDEEDPERLPEESEAPPPMPPVNLEPSEAEMEACRVAKQLADEASDVGDALGALERLTQAVMSGGAGALLFARRAEMLLQFRRPKAAITDCGTAIEVNPECGKAYRIRGIAHRRLGHWEAAQRDLLQGQKYDYDDEAKKVLVAVEEKLRQLEAKRKPARSAGRLQGKRAKVS